MAQFQVEFGKAKTVAAFLVVELGALAIFFVNNAKISGYIAVATAVLTAFAVYQIPNPVTAVIATPTDPAVITTDRTPPVVTPERGGGA